VSFPAHNVALDQMTERITDSLGKGHAHKVIHRKRFRLISGFADLNDYIWPGVLGGKAGSSADPGAGPYWYNFASSGVDYFTTFDTSNDVSVPRHWSINTSSFNEAQLKAAVLEKARQLKADVLLDIVEGNQIWPSIKSLALTLPALAKIVRQNTTLRSVSEASNLLPHISVKQVPLWNKVRPLMKTASGSFLAWKFGVAPLLSDFEAIHRYMPKLVNDVKRHAANDSKRFSSFAIASCGYDNSETAPTTINGYVVSVWMTQGRVVQQPEVRYVLVVKPNVTPFMTTFFQKADLFMSRFATSPARLAWEKIPFSFVLDWFVDLKGSLDALDKVVQSEPYQVISFTRSFTYKLATDVFFKRASACNGNTTFDRSLGSCDFSHYERIPVTASQSLVRWSPHFGKNQAAISAALIAQQLARIGPIRRA
jgi:hypothetical protein